MAAFSAAGAAEKKRELPGDHALTPSEGGSVETSPRVADARFVDSQNMKR